MKTVDRYVMTHIFGFTAVVGLGLMVIQAFITFVAEIDETGRGGFGYGKLFLYTLALAPTGFYVLMPIMAMIGTLMGLGALAAQSELTAMRASGVSLLRLGAATAGAGVVLGALCFAVGDWLAPAGQLQADALKSGAAGAGWTGRPVWLREGPHVFHIRRLESESHIGALEIYTLGPTLDLEAATQVEEARYVGDHWLFTGVRRTQFEQGTARVVEIPELDWRGTLSPDVLRLFVLEANALSVGGLVRLIRYLHQNNLDTAAYTLALARKLVAPFTVITMMLFAIPFVLGPLRNTGAGQRLFVGILVGLVFYVANEVSASTGQLYGWNPLLSAAAPTLAFAALAAWRLGRVR